MSALKLRGTSPSEDNDMVDSVKKAVRRLCASDVVSARLIEQEEKQRGAVECRKQLHWLTNGKVVLVTCLLCCLHRLFSLG